MLYNRGAGCHLTAGKRIKLFSGGKSGLRRVRVLPNGKGAKAYGKCNRKIPPEVYLQVRVKWCGKSAPGFMAT